MNDYLLGFDIGGTKCAVLLGRQAGGELDIISRTEFATDPARGPQLALENMEQAAHAALRAEGLSLSSLHGVGISCGGPLDNKRGIILGPPNLPGWDDIRISDRFASIFEVPVRLENDADACAVAEWMWGAGQGCRSMVFLTFGTGMGAGLILDGKIYSGAHGLAGEVGHIRLENDGPIGYGKRGSFEGFCSGGGIAQLAITTAAEYQARGENIGYYPPGAPVEAITAQVVAEAAYRGDSAALEVYEIVATKLGQGLAILVDILDPERIVIGSIFARIRDLLWPIASRVLLSEALHSKGRQVEVVPAALGDRVGDYACLALAARSRQD